MLLVVQVVQVFTGWFLLVAVVAVPITHQVAQEAEQLRLVLYQQFLIRVHLLLLL
jgi:hypothetical protein